MNPILAFIVIVLLLKILWSYIKQGKVYNFPPGPPRLPFIGSYLHLLWIDYYRPHISLHKLREHYNSPIIGFGMGPHNAIVANDYQSCKEVFNNPHLQGRIEVYPIQLRTFGKKHGIFGNDGDDWLHHKRSTLRTLRDFGFGRRSDPFEAVVKEEAKALVDHLNNTNGKAVVLPDELYPTLYNLILHLVHGVRFAENERSVLEEMGRTALRIITSEDNTGRLIAIWPWLKDVCPDLSGITEIEESSKLFKVFVKNSYDNHVKDFDEEVLRDLIDVLLKFKKINNSWTDEEVLITCEDLMFPNTAVAIVLSFTLGFVSKNPDILHKCQKELDEVVGRGRLPTLDDRSRLVMVESCLRETMRIQSLTPLGLAHRSTADTTLGGYDVPENSIVLTNLYSMHNDPKVWIDPENYRPERFLEPGVKDTTLPFGLGKRVCAGETFARQNLFIVFATILQNFNLETVVPLDSKRYRNGLVVAPNVDFSMRVIPRP